MSIMVLYQKKAKAFFSVLVETLFELVTWIPEKLYQGENKNS